MRSGSGRLCEADWLTWHRTHAVDLIVEEAVLFTGEESLFKCTDAILAEAIATVKPLSVPAPTVPSSPLKRSYLEELRSRGASAALILGRYAREQGNEHVKSGDAMKEDGLMRMVDRRGEPAVQKPEHWVGKLWCYDAANRDYADAVWVPEHAAVALCNSAAVYLKLKE